MMQKISDLIKKKRKDKKGQAIIELAFGTMLVAAMLMVIFDFALIVQTKTETMMMARNGVRYVIMRGLDVRNPSHNDVIAKQTESTIRGLYQLNHTNGFAQSLVRLSTLKVRNTERPEPIKDAATGKNPVFAQVCEQITPIGYTFYGNIEICSAYTGYHSSQYQANKNR